MDWPIYPGDNSHPFVFGYFRNLGYASFDFGWNFAYAYNDSVDEWFFQAYFSNSTARQVLYDKIADHLQNYEYPWLWVCQRITGSAWNSEWEILPAFYGGIQPFIRIRYVGGELVVPEVPGFMLGIILGSSLVAMLGVITVIKRKHKL